MSKANVISLLGRNRDGREVLLLPSLVDSRERNFRLHGVCFIDGKEMTQTFHVGCKVP